MAENAIVPVPPGDRHERSRKDAVEFSLGLLLGEPGHGLRLPL